MPSNDSLLKVMSSQCMKEPQEKTRTMSVDSKCHLLECQGGGAKGERKMLSLLPQTTVLLAAGTGKGGMTILK